MRFVSGIIALVYVLVGVLVANNNDYFKNVNDIEEIISAMLAVALWPLVLLGVDLDLSNAGDKGRAGGIVVASWMRRTGLLGLPHSIRPGCTQHAARDDGGRAKVEA